MSHGSWKIEQHGKLKWLFIRQQILSWTFALKKRLDLCGNVKNLAQMPAGDTETLNGSTIIFIFPPFLVESGITSVKI